MGAKLLYFSHIGKNFYKKFVYLKKKQYFCTRFEGEMAEWSIAAVLKTVELRGSGGSNPSLSASGELGKPSEAKMSRDVNLYFFCI